MSGFAFRLRRVLGVRRIEEDLARAEWLEAEQAASAAEAAARELQLAVERARTDLTALQSSPNLNPADVMLKQALVDRLREQWVQRTIQASRTRRESERLRQALAERRVRVRGLETLESKARQSFRSQTEAKANAELDERANLQRSDITTEHEDRAQRGTWNQS